MTPTDNQQLTTRRSDAEVVMEHLLKGWMPSSIAKLTGIDVDFIKRIKVDSEANCNEYMIASLTEIVSRSLDRIRTELADVDINRLPLNTAILLDKLQLLRGQATQRVEVRSVMSHKELIERIEKLTNSRTAKEINDDGKPGK